MKAKEIRELSGEQIAAELNALERKVFDMRTQGETEKLKSPSEVSKARRDIARLKTILRQRELAQSEE
ncbi:MAG: 50S ribosomal protein L29 [Phycisphaerae bacterium]|jgi:large subunit ribosomal protein L29|nr:50S ribosomal protein L29 [Phycisphaerae bacterium]